MHGAVAQPCAARKQYYVFSLPNYALRENHTEAHEYTEYHGLVCSATSLALVF